MLEIFGQKFPRESVLVFYDERVFAFAPTNRVIRCGIVYHIVAFRQEWRKHRRKRRSTAAVAAIMLFQFHWRPVLDRRRSDHATEVFDWVRENFKPQYGKKRKSNQDGQEQLRRLFFFHVSWALRKALKGFVRVYRVGTFKAAQISTLGLLTN